MNTKTGPAKAPIRPRRFWQRDTERRWFRLSREAIAVLNQHGEVAGGQSALADIALHDGFTNLPLVENGVDSYLSHPLRIPTEYSERSTEELSVILDATLRDYGRKRYEPSLVPGERVPMSFEIPRIFLRTQIRRAFHDRRDIEADKNVRLESVLRGLEKQIEPSRTDTVTAFIDEQLYYRVQARILEAELDFDTLIAWEFAKQL